METLKHILWPIVVVGGLGAFVDFLIGKAGQERAKEFLLKWWVLFDDVRWRNFGREESLFAGQLMEKWFGRRMWDFRRIAAFIISFIGALLLEYFWLADNLVCRYCDEKLYYGATALIISFLGFSISISFTKFISVRMADLCGTGTMKNLSLFFAMLIVNVIVLFIWSPIIGAIKGTVLDAFILSADKASVILDYTLYGNDSIFVQQVVAFDNLALLDTPALPSFFRVALSLVFVGSFLLKPLVIRPVNLLWRRIVESDKPVFTLVFGGAAAFASALGEAAKHL